MNEKVLVKSKNKINKIIILAFVYFIVGQFIGFAITGEYGPDFFLFCEDTTDPSFYVLWPTVILFIIGIILGRAQIVVTDKRVYGRILFRKRVDLPLDSISSVSTCWPDGIVVATSSGKIAFLMIKNKNEIHNCISELLIERQDKMFTTPIYQGSDTNPTDELREYKKLLDDGIITEEEFDAKKKQLLGL